MSSRYTAYPQRPAGVTEYDRVTVPGEGGKTQTAYKIYAGEVFCRVRIGEATDGKVILCGTKTKFTGRNILLNHIRLQHTPEHDAIVRISGKGKGGPNNAKAKNDAEVHFTELMILVDEATAKAHLSGLQQINNTMTAPQAAASQAATPSKRTKTPRKRSAFEDDDDEALMAAIMEEEESEADSPTKKRKTPTKKKPIKAPAKPKSKKTNKAAATRDENDYGFNGDTFVGTKSNPPMHRGKPNKTQMLSRLGLAQKTRCTPCATNNSPCPPPQFVGENWQDTNWEESSCQLLANYIQPEVEKD